MGFVKATATRRKGRTSDARRPLPDLGRYCASVSDAQAARAGAIEVQTSFSWLAFMLAAFKTRVVIDGQTYELPWGTNMFPVAAGRHHVRVSFKYLFPTDAGGNEVDVVVEPGQTVRVSYRPPWLVFLKGKIRVEENVSPGPWTPQAGAAGGPVSPAGWHPDPATRHEMRYWDGRQWTEHVSDQGAVSVDPL